MKYLLDVNALVALGFLQHEFHDRVSSWLQDIAAREVPELVTCSITELGFVRVLAQAPQYGFTVAHARALLLRLKRQKTIPLVFLSDDHDVSHTPAWVKTPKQVTDGHLVELARSKGAILATLDRGIRGAYMIPA
jgi:toxin-antitoxin system PIN domain toxin